MKVYALREDFAFFKECADEGRTVTILVSSYPQCNPEINQEIELEINND
jgi:hypothetical protein